ncbi:MAG: ATP-binding protein [Planctomycetota bacterium]
MKITFGCNTACLDLVRYALKRWLSQENVLEKLGETIVLAMDEALSNIILHGFKKNTMGYINVEFLRENDKINIIIEDNGEFFDITKVNPPQPLKMIRAGKTHGFGIYLIKTIMDEVRYEYSKKGGFNKLILIKYIK